MSDRNDYLLKYFFVVGVPEDMKEDLKINEVKDDNNLTPTLLSSYSAEGKTELFEGVKNLFNEDIYLLNNIFPKKADFLSNVIFDSNPLEPPTLHLKSNPFNQYIYTVNSFNQRPEYFTHCFQYIFKLDEKSEDNIILNFSVLVFFENVTDEKDLLNERNSKRFISYYLYKSKYYHTFIGKAIILVSEKPIFSLMKEILEYIYNKFITRKFSYFPVEPLIINCLDKINNDNDEEENTNQFKKYRLSKEPLFPYCDLNLSFFFKMFTLRDIFLIAEFYLCSKNIIVVSSNLDFLFPIYYILMTLFYPLNKNSNERFYKLLVPDEQNLQRTIFGMLPTFQFIYNDGDLDKKILNKICELKEEILYIQIEKDKNDKNEHCFSVYRSIMKYDSEEKKITKIDVTKYKNIIEKVFSFNYDIYHDLISFLINDVKEIKEYFDNVKKIPTFFDFSFDYKKYDLLRNHFIGLFIKFFVVCLNPIKFNINEKRIEIDIIDFKKFKDDSNANDLLSTLYTTPQSDLIYKNEIIKNGKFDTKILKKIILLDYFLKISSADKNRSYFEPKTSANKTELNEAIFDFKELFDYVEILDQSKNVFYYFNRLYLYPLQYPQKVYYIIDEARNFIEDIEYYQELTKLDKSKDIENIRNFYALNYIVFFGEKFHLHFGQFVNKNYKMHKNNNDNNKINISHLDFLKNNEKYEKYYKSTLDEAEIFYDLFVTQIIVSDNRIQLACCAISLFVSIYIIYLLSELSSGNPKKNAILEIINKNKEKLWKLFKLTNGFYGKYDFLITLLFEIVSNREFGSEYKELLIKKLEEEEILPTLIVILMYNHNISLNFRGIKEYFEESNKRNKMINKFEQRKSFNPMDELQMKKANTVILELKKRLQVPKINEISIYSIERNKHEHEYNIIDGINNDYNCENKNCSDILSFTIQKSEKDKKDVYFIYNPRYVIIKILKKILDNNSLFIYPYESVNDDIYQIAMLDQLYFNIGFFIDETDEKM